MSNPRPKRKTDYQKMPLETLLSLLEQTLPGFSFNLHHMGRDRPVMVNWRHSRAPLSAWEMSKLLMRTGTYRNLKTALVAILERSDAFDEYAEAERKRAQSVRHAPRPQPQPPRREPEKRAAPKNKEPEEPVLKVKPADPIAQLAAILKDTNG
jgi:hypothetical protein